MNCGGRATRRLFQAVPVWRTCCRGEGAGDDASSWVICGHRHKRWVAGSDSRLGTKCRAGAAIGCAVGVHTASAVVTSVSVNGSLAPTADGVAVAVSAAGHASSA